MIPCGSPLYLVLVWYGSPTFGTIIYHTVENTEEKREARSQTDSLADAHTSDLNVSVVVNMATLQLNSENNIVTTSKNSLQLNVLGRFCCCCPVNMLCKSHTRSADRK